MIQIDMPMPTNCLDCPACNEYLMCAIPINGRKFGENDVRDFSQSRPEWCPMKEQEKPNGKCVNECECWDSAYERGKQDALKEQEAVEPIPYHRSDGTIFKYECRKCRTKIFKMDLFCRHCGRSVKWEC